MQEGGEVDQYLGDCAKFEDMVVLVEFLRHRPRVVNIESRGVKKKQNGLIQKTSMEA